MLFVIQEGRHCMPTTDYYFTNIQPDPIIVSPHRRNHSELTAQHTAAKDQVSQQTHPLWPGETRVYPSMLADKQVPLSLPKQTFRQHFSPYICALQKKMSYHMAEKNPKKMRIPSDYLPDNDSSDEETSQHLHTSPEERLYHTVKGSAQATQVALADTMTQCNPTVKRGLAKQPKIKKLPKGQALDKSSQTAEKNVSMIHHFYLVTLYIFYTRIHLTLLRHVYCTSK